MAIRVDNNVKNQKTTPALYSDVYANIPAFGQTGRLFFATDTNTIYRDTGSAWVVFLANATVPSGLYPVGGNGTFVQSNGSGLQYVSLGVTSPLNIAQVGSTITFSIQQANSLQAGYLSSADWTTFNAKINGSGLSTFIPKFTAGGTIGNSTITDNGTTVATVSKLRIGTAPGSIYQVEIDGGVNIATGHEYRKNAVVLIPSSTNTIPKSNGAGVLVDSSITDNGTEIDLNNPVYITGNYTLALGNTPLTNTAILINNTITTSATSYGINNKTQFNSATVTSVIYYNSAVKIGGTFAGTSIIHFQASQDTWLGTSTNQYGFYVNNGMTSATNNYGFYSDLTTSGTSRWNLYINGTAPNYIAGRTNFGVTGNSVNSRMNVLTGLAISNNDFIAGSVGTYLQFSLGATSGNTNAFITALANGGTGITNIIFQQSGGRVIIGNVITPAYNLQLDTDSAAKPGTNTWTIASDSRVKTDIVPYTKGLAEILQLNPVEYKYNGLAGFDPSTGGIGIIAQEIQPVLPETVSTYFSKLKETDKKDTELLNFNSHALTFVLINAIKELKAEIDSLKN